MEIFIIDKHRVFGQNNFSNIFKFENLENFRSQKSQILDAEIY